RRPRGSGAGVVGRAAAGGEEGRREGGEHDGQDGAHPREPYGTRDTAASLSARCDGCAEAVTSAQLTATQRGGGSNAGVNKRTARVIISFCALLGAALVAAFTVGSSAEGASRSLSSGVVIIESNLGYEGGQGAGTGMVLTSSGEILTNHHVI